MVVSRSGLNQTLLGAAVALLPVQGGVRLGQDVAPAAPVAINVRVADRAGQPLADLQPADLQVRLDREAVGVTAVQRLPAAAGSAGAGRRVVVVVDRATLPSAGSRPLLEAAASLLDHLSATELGAVWTIPAAGSELVFTTDRALTRAALTAATGIGSPQSSRFSLAPADLARIDSGPGNALDLVAERECPAGDRDQVARCRDELQREAAALAEHARLRAAATAREVAVLVRAVGRLTGAKHLILVSGGGSVAAGDAARAIAADAARGRVTIHAIIAAASDVGAVGRFSSGGGQEATLETGLADATGGVTAGGRDPQAAAGRIERELAAEYVLTLVVADALRDGRPHDLDVRILRPAQAAVRAARQVVFEPSSSAGAAPAPPASPPAPAPVATPPEAVAEPPAPAAPALDQVPLQALLARAASYVNRFTAEMATAVLEEHYVQLIKRRTLPPTAPDEERLAWHPKEAPAPRDATIFKRRQTKADLLLVQLPNRTWAAYRDTFEVDGKTLAGRENRLRKLFVEGTRTSERQMRRINQDSANWNLGRFYREINLPTFPLLVLRADNQQRMVFGLGPTARVGDATCRIVTFKETMRPTMVHSFRRGEDVPLAGTVCVDETGIVWRTHLDLSERYTWRGLIEVTYAPNPRVKVPVPGRMWEWYQPPPMGAPREFGSAVPVTQSELGCIEALATYSNLRRFTVETTEQVK